MCGRYLFTESESEDIRNIIIDIESRAGEGTVKLGEIFPTDRVPVMIAQSNEISPELLTWGFPGYRGNKSVIINACSETAHDRPMFRSSLITRRCIIPSTGFFEWGHVKSEDEVNTKEGLEKYGTTTDNTIEDMQIGLWPETPTGKFKDKPARKATGKPKKQKYLFNIPGEKVLYMAGLYNIFEGEQRFVILTTEANSSIADVHNRMPLVLRKDLINDWLFNDERVVEILRESQMLEKKAV